jgi:zinc transport system ATP-binding protein
LRRLPGKGGVMLVEADRVTLRRGGQTVLQDVTLSIREGEIVTLIGPNGSGKTTLLRALLGIERPAQGRVTRRDGLRIGYVPQRLSIDRSLPITARRFLSVPVRVSKTCSRSYNAVKSRH